LLILLPTKLISPSGLRVIYPTSKIRKGCAKSTMSHEHRWNFIWQRMVSGTDTPGG
jgi:hypothetical protein